MAGEAVGRGPGVGARPLGGRTVVVTGASAGIGAAAARRLAELGAGVVVVGRCRERTAAVAGAIGAVPVFADFARLDDVRRAADEILGLCPRIDVLANNAGAMFPDRRMTVDGHEMTFQVNHLAGFLLTGLLLPRLTTTPNSRVIMTSSVINVLGCLDLDDLDRFRRPYRQFSAYADSKLANVLFVRELTRRAAAAGGPAAGGPTATAFHPGFIASNIGRDTRHITRLKGRWWSQYVTHTPGYGAQPLVALAVRVDPRAVDGAYLHRFRRHEHLLVSRAARDPELARRLWDRCSALVGLSA
ncbi:SDR family NAD(P)-dependent oxidoreductase [Frankia sp. CN7]|uniref:SDR family NAD(P)-dependent oxidoreductase n=2 Tax=Frankia nepalensis TaxID=1836974 RepID=A0A937RGQ3_9ACTN|nr:SDR family NAD(P)-dependent oxidoreductase [Frankia nepalensis]MBL7510168.1 SDR family NAD(P)-dependent oxidoreductase [Frankia nepalensis]MBL7626048.1 SDR family NAD(P)-dependent oxidoreductase [Frankia nepalensis]